MRPNKPHNLHTRWLQHICCINEHAFVYSQSVDPINIFQVSCQKTRENLPVPNVLPAIPIEEQLISARGSFY